METEESVADNNGMVISSVVNNIVQETEIVHNKGCQVKSESVEGMMNMDETTVGLIGAAGSLSSEFDTKKALLTVTEFNALPEPIKSRAENLQRLFQSTIASKNDLVREKINTEQKLNEANENLVDRTERLGELSDVKSKLEERLSLYEKERNQHLEGIQKAQSEKDAAAVAKNELQRQVERLESERHDLMQLVDTRKSMIDSFKVDFKSQADTIKQLTLEKNEAIIAADNVAAKENTLAFRQQRWEEEQKIVAEENERKMRELSHKERIIGELKCKISSLEMEHEYAISVKGEQLTEVKLKLDDVQKSNVSLTNQINDLNDRLKTSCDDLVVVRERYEQELSVQSKLVDHYKGTSQEAEEKAYELTTAIESMKVVFNESKQALTEKNEEMEAKQNEADQELQSRDHTIAELKDELEKANELLRSKHRVMLTDEEVMALSPGAAAASRLIRSGMTLTGIYRDHIRIAEELEEKKTENRTLTAHIREIVADIEEKAPRIRQQREEYERILGANERMQTQLKESGNHEQGIRQERDRVMRELKYTKKELERYQQDNADLGTQVRRLLATIHHTQMDTDEEQDSSMVFRNIDELQSTNQRLMSELRGAESKREEMVATAQELERSKMKCELENAMSELNGLRNHRKQQDVVIETLKGQREQYKKMYETECENKKADASEHALNCSSKADVDSAPATNKVEEVEKELAIFKREKEAVDKINNDKIDELQKKTIELSNTNTKLNTELMYQEERFKILTNNAEVYKKEANNFRDRLSEKVAVIARLEQRNSDIAEKLMEIQNDVASTKVENRHMHEQMAMVRGSENMLLEQIEGMRKEARNNDMLATTIKQMEMRSERVDAEQKHALEEKLFSLTQEKNILADKLKQHEEEQKHYVHSVRARREELETEVERERLKLRDLKGKLDVKEKLLTDSLESNAELQAQMEEMRNDRKDATTERFQKEAQQLQARLNYQEAQLRERNILLQSNIEQLERSKAEVGRLMGMSETMEESIQKQKESNDTSIIQVQSQLQTVTQERNAALDRESKASNEIIGLKQKLEDIVANANRKSAEHRANIDNLEGSVRQISSELNDWKEKERLAREDRDATAINMQDFERKYAAEMNEKMQIQSKVQGLEAELNQKQTQLSELIGAKELLEKELAGVKMSLSEVEGRNTSQKEALSNRIKDLETQNAKFVEEMAKLGNQVAVYEKQGSETARDGDSSGDKTDSGTSQNSATSLMEVIRLLRKETSTAVQHLETANMEKEAQRCKVSVLEARITELKSDLAKAKEMESALAEATTQKAKLMSQLNIMDELRANNKNLVEEKQKLTVEMHKLEAKTHEHEAALQQTVAAKQTLDYHIQTLTRDLESARNEGSTWKTRHNDLVGQRAQIENKQLVQLRQDLQAKESQLSEMANIRNKLSQAEFELKSLQTQNAKHVEESAGEIADVKSKLIDTQQNLDKVQADLDKTNKVLAQARQLALKYKKMHAEVDGKFKTLVAEKASAPPTAAQPTAAEPTQDNSAQVAELQSKCSQLEKEKTELEAKVTALESEKTQLEASMKEAETRAAEGGELGAKLSALQSQMKNLRSVAAESGQKIIAEMKSRKEAEEKLKVAQQQLEELNKTLSESEEMKKRMGAISTSHRKAQDRIKQLEAQLKRGKEDDRIVGRGVGDGAVGESSTNDGAVTAAIVQPVVPQPSHSRVISTPQRFPPSVASVPPFTGTRRLQPSPGPTLPDQSSSSSGHPSNKVGRIMGGSGVSTSAQPSVSSASALPQAVVNPHPHQEHVSASSDAGPTSSTQPGNDSTGPSSSSSASVLPAQQGRKRTTETISNASVLDKRVRTDEVSTSDPEVLPFSSGRDSSGIGNQLEPSQQHQDDQQEGEDMAGDIDNESELLPGEEVEESSDSDDDGDDVIDEGQQDDEDDGPDDIPSNNDNSSNQQPEDHNVDSEDDDEIQIIDEEQPQSSGMQEAPNIVDVNAVSGDGFGDEIEGLDDDGIVPQNPLQPSANNPNEGNVMDESNSSHSMMEQQQQRGVMNEGGEDDDGSPPQMMEDRGAVGHHLQRVGGQHLQHLHQHHPTSSSTIQQSSAIMDPSAASSSSSLIVVPPASYRHPDHSTRPDHSTSSSLITPLDPAAVATGAPTSTGFSHLEFLPEQIPAHHHHHHHGQQPHQPQQIQSQQPAVADADLQANQEQEIGGLDEGAEEDEAGLMEGDEYEQIEGGIDGNTSETNELPQHSLDNAQSARVQLSTSDEPSTSNTGQKKISLRKPIVWKSGSDDVPDLSGSDTVASSSGASTSGTVRTSANQRGRGASFRGVNQRGRAFKRGPWKNLPFNKK